MSDDSLEVPLPSPATHGLGYLIMPKPHTSTFRNVGRHHVISFFPDSYIKDMEDTVICLWLGPDIGYLKAQAYLIRPGVGILILGKPLTADLSSQVLALGGGEVALVPDPPTAIAADLLQLNKEPCVLFICSATFTDPEQVKQEAERLSFRTQVLEAARDLVAFLEKSAVPGDAVHSSCLAEWYRIKFAGLRSSTPTNFLFDPSVLVVRIVEELVMTLKTVNKFDVAHRDVLTPLELVRSWERSFKEDVNNDDLVLLVRLTGELSPFDPNISIETTVTYRGLICNDVQAIHDHSTHPLAIARRTPSFVYTAPIPKAKDNIRIGDDLDSDDVASLRALTEDDDELKSLDEQFRRIPQACNFTDGTASEKPVGEDTVPKDLEDVPLLSADDRDDVEDSIEISRAAKADLGWDGGPKLPSVCPFEDCQDVVPPHPSKFLLSMLNRHQILIRKGGFEHVETVKSGIFIHTELFAFREMLIQRGIAQANGWPVDIDFGGLPMRIIEMRDQLKRLMNHTGITGNGPVERAFRKVVSNGGGIARLARLPYPPEAILHQSRPGYYGPKGTAIIQSTLLRLFGPNAPSPAFKPLSLAKATSYFLVPYVAHRLIAQDMGLSLDGAYNIMIASSSAGQALQAERDDDEEIDEIHRDNVYAAKKEREKLAHRKGRKGSRI